MGSRQGVGARRGRWGMLALVGFAVVLVPSAVSVSVSGQDQPAARYRSAPELPVGTTARELLAQRQTFRYRLDAIQAEIGQLNRALDAQRKGITALDEQVIQAHLNMLAADHLLYEAQRRGLPDLLDRQLRAAERRRDWELLEARYRVEVEAESEGLLQRLSDRRAQAADLVVDWNLANDRLRLLDPPPTAKP